VRDNVRHSSDHRFDPATGKASDVLWHKAGYCDAKSHLLAAMLPANTISAGYCYQHLSTEGGGTPY